MPEVAGYAGWKTRSRRACPGRLRRRIRHPVSNPDFFFSKPSSLHLRINSPSLLQLGQYTVLKMPSKLSKVQKSIGKKKGSKINALHENSRDAQRLRRAGSRDDTVARKHSVREKANLPWLDRVNFFKDNLPDTLHPLTVPEMQDLVERFVHRADEDLEQLKQERRKGRPPSTWQTLIEQHMDLEGKEYESGFWMPDLRDEETLVKLDGWKREWPGLGQMRYVRLDKNGVINESHFPPKGSS